MKIQNVVDSARKALEAVDGNKTKIGVAITAVGALVELKYPEVGSQVKVAGEVVATGGLAHGSFKWFKLILAFFKK